MNKLGFWKLFIGIFIFWQILQVIVFISNIGSLFNCTIEPCIPEFSKKAAFAFFNFMIFLGALYSALNRNKNSKLYKKLVKATYILSVVYFGFLFLLFADRFFLHELPANTTSLYIFGAYIIYLIFGIWGLYSDFKVNKR